MGCCNIETKKTNELKFIRYLKHKVFLLMSMSFIVALQIMSIFNKKYKGITKAYKSTVKNN